MLTIQGDPHRGRFCDGLSRRSFLRIGGLVMGGLSLPQILEAETAQTTAGSGGAARSGKRSHKAVIMIFLPGGPPHQDMFDLKMDAPREIRGEFRPIPTSVPGIEICELFPRIARMAERFTFVRSIVGATGSHYSFQCLTGRDHRNQPQGGRRSALICRPSRARSIRPCRPSSAWLPPWDTSRGRIPARQAFSGSPTGRFGRPVRARRT